MLIIFVVVFLLALLSLSINKNKNDILSLDTTLSIKGLLAIIIIFSHLSSYVTYGSSSEMIFSRIIQLIGQLMVAPFFFFSGYGIYEKIKINKKKYIDDFLRRRFLKVYIPFFLALILYIIYNFFTNQHYEITTIIVSFTGWESIGNSNWFMFATFAMYLSVVLFFQLDKDNISIALVFIGMFLYSVIVSKFKSDYFYNTVFCFPIGILFSYYKNKIISLVLDRKKMISVLLILTSVFLISYYLHKNVWFYQLQSVSFVLIVALLTSVFSFDSSFFKFIGKHSFSIYILQRMAYDLILLLSKNLSITMSITIYFICSFLLTIFISVVFDKLVSKVLIKL